MNTGRPEVAVGAIVIHAGALLAVRRGRPPSMGRWAPPGGRVEAGESIADAVVRELAEETGLTGVCGALVGIVERIGTDHHFVIHDHRVTLQDPDAPLRPGDDAADAAWIPLAEIDAWHCVDGLAAFLAEHGLLDNIL